MKNKDVKFGDYSNIVRCKDCIHKPTNVSIYTSGSQLEFPDYVCPCQCSDSYNSYYRGDNWFCSDGESKI